MFLPQSPLTFTRQSYLLAARLVYHYVLDHGRLPHAIRSHGVDCGPAEALRALAKALEREKLPDSMVIEPTVGLPECSTMDFFQRARAAASCAPPGYTCERINMMGRQQSWSYRPIAGVQ